MDYRGRIYPITSILTYISSDPYRASFKFREGRKLGGKQSDGLTGFEWLLIHVVSVSEKKKKATHEECLRYAYENFHFIVDSGRRPLDGYRWWETCAAPFQTIACCIEIYQGRFTIMARETGLDRHPRVGSIGSTVPSTQGVNSNGRSLGAYTDTHISIRLRLTIQMTIKNTRTKETVYKA